MEEVYKGGCACGAVRYFMSNEPVFSNHCQCRDCQIESGTGHSSYLTFERDFVNIEGSERARFWDMTGDSGHLKTRAFCPTCGVAVYLTFSSLPNVVAVRAATLDNPSRFQPQAVTYAKCGYSWDHLDPDLPRFDRMPPG